MFWNKKPPAKNVGEQWAVYTYVYGDQQRAIVSFDADAAREEVHCGHPHCVRAVVRVPLDRVLENGLPEPPAVDELQRLEEAFIKILLKNGVDFRLVGKMTYGGMRDFVFQVEEVAAFKEAMAKASPTAGMTLQLLERPGWTFFDEKVRPAPVYWQQIGDFQVIQGLIRAGSNPRVPHLLEHVFAGERDQLETLRIDLIGKGFAEVSRTDTHLIMGRESLLDLESVFGVTAKLFTLCPKIGVQYEGWGSRVYR